MDLHEPPVATRRRSTAAEVLPAQTQAPPAAADHTRVKAKPAAAGLLFKGMPRIASCPQQLAALSAPTLIKPEYSHRNHKQFLDLYELGRVLGTGGYAVVRECTRKSTGERFAAKMMTVSEYPESGGREVDRQVCPPLAAVAPKCRWLLVAATAAAFTGVAGVPHLRLWSRFRGIARIEEHECWVVLTWQAVHAHRLSHCKAGLSTGGGSAHATGGVVAGHGLARHSRRWVVFDASKRTCFQSAHCHQVPQRRLNSKGKSCHEA